MFYVFIAGKLKIIVFAVCMADSIVYGVPVHGMVIKGVQCAILLRNKMKKA